MRNNTDQVINSGVTATVEFNDVIGAGRIHRNPDDASVYVYSAANDDFEFLQAGLYKNSITVPIGEPSNSGGGDGNIWVELNNTLITGLKYFVFSELPGGQVYHFDFNQQVVAGDKLRVRIQAPPSASVSAYGGTLEQYARWDIESVCGCGPTGSTELYIGKVYDEISAATGGDTSGSGQVNVWKNDTATMSVQASSAILTTPIAVRNCFASVITVDTMVIIAKDAFGTWWVISAEC